jgi:hypothetical protein
MRLYKKEGNIIQILSFPNENVEKGDYLLIEDAEAQKALIAQVIDVQFANIPGVLEELLRSLPDGGGLIQGEDIDPLEIAPSHNIHPGFKTFNLQDPRYGGRRNPKPKHFLASVAFPVLG